LNKIDWKTLPAAGRHLSGILKTDYDPLSSERVFYTKRWDKIVKGFSQENPLERKFVIQLFISS
jgi:hypothetical protein